MTDGVSLFLVGLFKKLALANYLALYVDRIYDNPAALRRRAAGAGHVRLRLADLLAISAATPTWPAAWREMMGFNLILNFNNPYLATGLGEFWSRWHISLSTWFRDYVYIPLGGNRRGRLLTVPQPLDHVRRLRHLARGLLDVFDLGPLARLGRDAHPRSWSDRPFYRDRVPKLAQAGLASSSSSVSPGSSSAPTRLADANLIVQRIFTAPWIWPVGEPCRSTDSALMLLLVALIWLYALLYESSGAAT